jgi:hypothetical protein
LVEIGLAMTGEWAIAGNHIVHVAGEAAKRRKVIGLLEYCGCCYFIWCIAGFVTSDFDAQLRRMMRKVRGRMINGRWFEFWLDDSVVHRFV